MINFLRIALWNANGLPQHRQEVEVFLKEQKIDILLVSETHFTDRNYFNIQNYNTYHTNHPDGTAHGGTAVIISNKITLFEINKYETNYLQATNVTIKDTNGHLTVSAVYCPPRHSIKRNQFEDFFQKLGSRFIAGGDYNAKHPKWGSRLTNPKGRELLTAMLNNNYDVLSTGKPTYWPTDLNKIPDVLDIFVTKGISPNYINVSESFDLSSDHSPIIATICTTLIKKEMRAKLTNKKTDFNTFQKYLNDLINLGSPLKSNDDIENAVDQLTSNIQKAAWQSTPAINTIEDIPNYPKYIRDMISEKRKARKTWHTSRHPSDKTRLNNLSKKLKNILYKFNDEALQEKIQNLSPSAATDYSLWKVTKKLKRPKQHIPPIRKPDNTWAKSDEEKAETFAEHLSNIFKPNPPQTNIDEENMQSYLNSPLQLSLPIKHFSACEVEQEIKYLNNKKSPGYDLITATALKNLPKKGIVAITQIFNAIIRIQYVPIQWKFSQIILILKPGKPNNDPNSYRPISLLPILSKLLEKLILKRIKPLIEDNNIIPSHQFGFRNLHSTTEQIHRIVSKIEKSFEEQKFCSAAFLDIKQAFDRVWYTGLLYKIKKLLPHPYYLLIKSYLTDRYFQVSQGNTNSKYYQIEAGVPQGSVLGPTLYQIYTSDLPCEDDEDVTIATYADDTAILASNEEPEEASRLLQKTLDKVQTWANKWRIKVNESKSVHITFTTKHKTCPEVTFNNQIVPQKSEVKYLGMYLDKRLTWKPHLQKKRKQLDLKIKQMNWIIGRKSKLSLSNKLLLYKVIIIPIWTYGIQIWGCAKKSNIDIIQRLQNKTLRIIANAPWFITNEALHSDLNIKTINEQMKIFSKKYENRLNYHPNELAVNLLNTENEIRRLNRKKPLDLSI